jgi:hypothetical protein
MPLAEIGFGVSLCAVSLAFAPLATGASLRTGYNVIVSGNFEVPVVCPVEAAFRENTRQTV